jgi:hypothetical protein
MIDSQKKETILLDSRGIKNCKKLTKSRLTNLDTFNCCSSY